ncbi:Nicastrin and/or Peptidase M28 domain containing protein [Asbolus verrucosus]|uniref:Nicastrin n=1 Tax=Asbolus verrucosus TaxID=1661398 RepID=A0A482V814_ASBVE|nr:Nicastrin and/or Peptidase M28 domain containing protein [Asbolus verrucosus]
MAYNFQSESEVKDFIKNLGIEYRFGCYSEKKPEVCHLLADYLESIDKNYEKAGIVYRNTCDDYKYAKSCSKYATYVLLGKGTKKSDFKAAYNYFEKGCDLDDPTSCFHQGLLLIAKNDGQGIAQNPLKGMSLLEKSCKAEHSNACYYLSGMYISGVKKPNSENKSEYLVQRDMEKAFQFALKGCELGNMYSCANLSQMYAKGDAERGGSTGVIHYCERQADLDFILKNGTAPPYVPIIPTSLFNIKNLNVLKSSEKISGLLLYANEEKLDHFTHENQCPNPQSSLKDTCKANNEWNPFGTGLMYQDIPFPVFYVQTEDSIAFAKECFSKHNNYSFDSQRDRSLCSLQLVSFMFAATNSPTCIRRSNLITNLNPPKLCDPLGDKNVWATLFPLVNGTNFTEPINFRYIVVAARLDTTSMFYKTAGAISPVTGLVTLLSTAKYLKAILPTNKNFTRNVLFLLFNGESYDYIGSQRFVYELLKGNFPSKSKKFLPNITIDDIDLYIELSQLNATETLVAHYLRDGKPERFLLKLQAQARNEGLDLELSEDTLPPASLHTFLKNRTDLPSLILADHKTSYKNHFYNSVYDNATNLNYTYLNITANETVIEGIQSYVQNVSTMLAKSLYFEITDEKYDNETAADVQFIDELFHCYLEEGNCKVHQAIQQVKWQHEPFSLYVGVDGNSNVLTTLIGLTLGWVTGDSVGKSSKNCTNEPKNPALRYYNMSQSVDDLNTTLCYRITMNFTEAVSPAFVIHDYDWSSGEYSTWTESIWNDFRLRIFLKPSASHENMTVAIGSIL